MLKNVECMLFRRNSEICERTGKGSGRAGGEKIRKENRKKGEKSIACCRQRAKIRNGFGSFFCVEKMEKENKIWLMSGRR